MCSLKSYYASLRMDTNVFDLHAITNWAVLSYVDHFLYFIVEDNILFLSFVILYNNPLKYISGTAQIFQ